MARDHDLVGRAAVLLGFARVANLLLLASILGGIAGSWFVPSFFHDILIEADPAIDAAEGLKGIRLLMLIGIVMTVAVDRLLAPLSLMVEDARRGDPFVPANAARLRRIGWALLVLQLLDLAAAWLKAGWPSLGSAAPTGDISIGGWLATLLVFVLARVFAAGSAMRDDLAGTI